MLSQKNRKYMPLELSIPQKDHRALFREHNFKNKFPYGYTSKKQGQETDEKCAKPRPENHWASAFFGRFT
jgi:hypothetical protein